MEITLLSFLITLCVGVHGSSSEILQRQKRWIIDSFSIDEGYDGQFPYSLGHIKVEDEVVIFSIHGAGVDEEPRNLLKINGETGELWVLGPVDHEQYQKLQLTFQAFDKNRNVIHTKLGILLRILDANDCAPTFERERYEISVKESASQGSDLIAVKATDNDLSEIFRQFDLRIVSVSPQPQDVEFYLTQFPDEIGTISFKGCLDHEKAERYTIIVEAKERGLPAPFSSSCTIVLNIEDQNNHLPVITQQKAVVKVREDQENVLLLRVPVTDEDTKDTPFWRVKFHIQDDTGKNFKITTDTKTNEGLLYLIKRLDFEESPVKNITVTVENEVPHYTCNVLERSTTGLWTVAHSGDTVAGKLPPSTRQQVTVIVENVNEAPVFDLPDQSVTVIEDVEVGTYLKTFSAKDPDVKSADRIMYKKGKDLAGWITVDAKTGKVTTAKIIDRESSLVNNSVYVATVHAVDDGKPPMTSTATLSIQIVDKNDNTPLLVSNIVDLCQSDKRSTTRIEALDLDADPNAGPFHFRLLGNVQNKWKVEPSHGFSVNLVKENTVHSGHFDLMMEVGDRQGSTAVHNLSVTVCSCSDPSKPNCRLRKSAVPAAGGATVAIILLSLLLFAGLLLLVLLFSCQRDKIPLEDESSGNLMVSNTEKQGTDCEVIFNNEPSWNQIQMTTQAQTKTANPVYELGMQSFVSQTESLLKQPKTTQWFYDMSLTDASFEDPTQHPHLRRDGASLFHSSKRMSLGASSKAGMKLQRRTSNYANTSYHLQTQQTMLNKKLHELETQSHTLGDDQPHVYAEEGDSQHNFQLDAISMSEVNFDPNSELDVKFSDLASICMPIGNAGYGTKAQIPRL